MKFRTHLKKITGPSAIAIGNFDGFHAGHKKILDTLKKTAHREGLLSLVLTFHPHPRIYFQHPVQLISTDKQRQEILRREAPDYLFFIEFARVVDCPAHDFVRNILLDTLKMKVLIIGADFRFGRNREGDLGCLRQEAKSARFKIIQSRTVQIGGCRVASSVIRKKLAAGRILEANRLLEKPYYIDGIVKSGAGRGKKLGFPTINIATENQILPAGVFHTRTAIRNVQYESVTNIGFTPTFAAETSVPLKIETHIPGFEQSIYGEPIRIIFVDKIREERKFASVQSLIKQIRLDIASLNIANPQ